MARQFAAVAASKGKIGTKSNSRRAVSNGLWAAFFLAPMMAGLTVFYFGPIIVTIYLSFHHVGVFGGTEWVGLDNYVEVLTAQNIRKALSNTLIYTAIISCSIPISLIIAALLGQRGLKFVWLFRLIFFLPVITLPVAVGWLWKIILNGNYGLANSALELFGFAGQPWLTQPSTALAAVSLVGIWASLGYPVVLFIAALQGVPRDLLEAAEIDGAGPIRRFVSITLPLISPTIFFVTVLTIIGALQMFDLVFVMIGGQNPAIAETETVVFLFYRTAFTNNDKGLASAIVLCLMGVVMLLTFIQFRLQKRWVHYG